MSTHHVAVQGWTYTRGGHIPGVDIYQGWTYTRGGHIPGVDIYQGWTYTRGGHIPGVDIFEGGVAGRRGLKCKSSLVNTTTKKRVILFFIHVLHQRKLLVQYLPSVPLYCSPLLLLYLAMVAPPPLPPQPRVIHTLHTSVHPLDSVYIPSH